MNRDQLTAETIAAADNLTNQLIADYIASGMTEAAAQMQAAYDVKQYLLEWRALGAEI